MPEHKLFALLGVLTFALPLLSSREAWNWWEGGLTIASIVVLLAWLMWRRYQHQWLVLGWLFVFLLALHAQWGVTQFVLQRDVGLYLLGETRLSISADGVAKFFFAGEKLVRAYGGFPHANVFGGSLVLALLVLSSLTVASRRVSSSVFLAPLVGVLILGIYVSFSRSAYLALGIIFLLTIYSHCRSRSALWRSSFLPLLIGLLVMSPLLWARATDTEDVGVSERLLGARWAIGLLEEQPHWFGSRIPYEERLRVYLDRHFVFYQPWQIDYVHSTVLLLMLQLGILPTGVLAGLVVWVSARYYGRRWVWLLPLVPLLTFDHFLFTQMSAFVYLVGAYFLMPRFLS